MTRTSKLNTKIIGIYLIIFLVLWSVRELVIQPLFLDSLSAAASAIAGEMIKLAVWTLPAVLLIRFYRDDMWIGLKEMLTSKPKGFKDAYILLFVFLPLLQGFLIHGEIAVHPDFMPARLIGAVLFVGITEEIVFRGFLLNGLLKKMKQRSAIALNEVLFVLIHYPIWIYNGWEPMDFLAGSAAVFVLGVLFSYSFIKSRSIWVPIALHMVWNLLSILLFG